MQPNGCRSSLAVRQPNGCQGDHADEPIRREVTIVAAPRDVWDAITGPAELAAWFDAETQIDLRLGGAVRFTWPDGIERRG